MNIRSIATITLSISFLVMLITGIPVYSGDGSSGQPSPIYQAIVDSQTAGQHLFELVGHGHHSGADGQLYQDLSNITTAKDILSFVVASVE